MKSNQAAKASVVDEIKIFDDDDKTTKQRLKFLIMIDKVAKQRTLFLRPCHHQKFFNSRKPWLPGSISHLFHPGLF